MSFSLADLYYIKALDSVDYQLDEAIEYLNYAMSADLDHDGANQLMGKLYYERFSEFDLAEEYLNRSFASNPDSAETCFVLIDLFVSTDRFEKALELVEYSRGIRGCRKSMVYQKHAKVLEHQRKYSEAVHQLHLAIIESYSDSDVEYHKSEIKRIKIKQRELKKLKDGSKKVI